MNSGPMVLSSGEVQNGFQQSSMPTGTQFILNSNGVHQSFTPFFPAPNGNGQMPIMSTGMNSHQPQQQSQTQLVSVRMPVVTPTGQTIVQTVQIPLQQWIGLTGQQQQQSQQLTGQCFMGSTNSIQPNSQDGETQGGKSSESATSTMETQSNCDQSQQQSKTDDQLVKSNESHIDQGGFMQASMGTNNQGGSSCQQIFLANSGQQGSFSGGPIVMLAPQNQQQMFMPQGNSNQPGTIFLQTSPSVQPTIFPLQNFFQQTGGGGGGQTFLASPNSGGMIQLAPNSQNVSAGKPSGMESPAKCDTPGKKEEKSTRAREKRKRAQDAKKQQKDKDDGDQLGLDKLAEIAATVEAVAERNKQLPSSSGAAVPLQQSQVVYVQQQQQNCPTSGSQNFVIANNNQIIMASAQQTHQQAFANYGTANGGTVAFIPVNIAPQPQQQHQQPSGSQFVQIQPATQHQPIILGNVPNGSGLQPCFIQTPQGPVQLGGSTMFSPIQQTRFFLVLIINLGECLF